MTYIVLDLSENLHGGPVKVVGTLDKDQIESLVRDYEYETDQIGDNILLDEYVAVPIDNLDEKEQTFTKMAEL